MKIHQKYLGILLLFLLGIMYSCIDQDDTLPRINISIGDHQLELENYGYYAELEASSLKEGQIGEWSVVRGMNGRFEDASNPNTVFQGEPGEIYSLQWTVTENGHSESEMIDVSFKALNVSQNNTYPDTVKTSFTLHLDANGTKYGAEGMWTYEGAEGAFFEEVDSCATKFVGLPNETYELTWTVTYGSKEEHSSFEVTFDSLRADVGGEQLHNIAYGERLFGTLYPNHQEGASVKWTILEGKQGKVYNPTDANSLFEGIEGEIYKLRYEIAHGDQTDEDTLLYSFNRHNIWVDPADNQEYKTIKVNGVEWMAENYNLAVPNADPDFPHSWYYGQDKGGVMIDGEAVVTPEDRKYYGRLYSYIAAMEMAPEGWRLPELEEINDLVNTFGGESYGGIALKEGGRSGMEMRMGGSYIALGDTQSYGQGVVGNYWFEQNVADPYNSYLQLWVLLADEDGSYSNILVWYYGCSVRYVREIQ